jgi:hypothetical protein
VEGLESKETTFGVTCGSNTPLENQKIVDQSEKAYTILVGPSLASNQMEIVVSHVEDDREKPEEGFPKLRFLAQGVLFEQLRAQKKGFYVRLAGSGSNEFSFTDFDINPLKSPMFGNSAGWASETRDDLEPIDYSLFLEIDGEESLLLTTMKLDLGGSYIATITPNYTRIATEPANPMNPEQYIITNHILTAPSSMHMFWLLPQYIIITMGEIMFSVTGLEFSYSQSPVSMKSVLQAAWLLTVAFGNLIVVIVAEAKFFEEQSKEFFLFAGLMFVDMLIFMVMAWRYIPAKLEDPKAAEIEGKKVDE